MDQGGGRRRPSALAGGGVPAPSPRPASDNHDRGVAVSLRKVIAAAQEAVLQAVDQGDRSSARQAAAYASDPVLSAFAAPAVKLARVDLTVRFAAIEAQGSKLRIEVDAEELKKLPAEAISSLELTLETRRQGGEGRRVEQR